MSSLEENHVVDWLPDFVLDVLAEAEMKGVSAHLVKCPTCRVEFARLQQVVDELPLALVQTAPPPELKRKLMQSIHSSREKSGTVTDRATITQKLRDYFRKRLPAISLALIIILALGNLLLWRLSNATSNQASTPMKVILLKNTQYSSGAFGTLIMDPSGKYGTLVVDNLAPLNADKQYQVWLIKSAYRTSGGVFSVNVDGYASLEIQAPLPLAQYDEIGISIEPMGGSSNPTGSSVFHAYLFK